MEVPDDQNKIRLFVQFDEPRPVLVINSESVKPFIHAFERFKIKGWVEGIGEKQGFLFLKLFRTCPTFYTLCTSLILGPLSTNSAMSKERYLIA
jgi:hypothetical protein